jgi:hypothetical protein
MILLTFRRDEMKDGIQADHLNRNTLHNCLCNLKPATTKEQAQNKDMSNVKKSTSPIRCIYPDGKTKDFLSRNDAEKELEIRTETIQSSIKNNKPTRYGLSFSRIQPEEDVGECKIGYYKDTKYEATSKGYFKLSNGYWSLGNLTASKYKNIQFRVGNKSKKIDIHILILNAFDPLNGRKGLTVNHKNKNRSDNRIENLEWLTIQQQNEHACGKIVQQWTLDGKLKKEFLSLTKAEQETGINHTNISRVIYGDLLSAGGFGWKLKDETQLKRKRKRENNKREEDEY